VWGGVRQELETAGYDVVWSGLVWDDVVFLVVGFNRLVLLHIDFSLWHITQYWVKTIQILTEGGGGDA